MKLLENLVFRDVKLKKCKLYKKNFDSSVECLACQHKCNIGVNDSGICGVRVNDGGELKGLYDYISYARVDPIEQKPVFHYRPGTKVYSVGGVGCNFHCTFCQNYKITGDFSEYLLAHAPPNQVIHQAKKKKAEGIAFTFNEPTITIEYAHDLSKIARRKGLYTVFVTNGYLSREAIEYITPYTDAFIVGVKTFSEEFYRSSCGSYLSKLKESIRSLSELANHMEISYLVTNEDSNFDSFLSYYHSLSKKHPLHLGKFFPEYKCSNMEFTNTPKLIEYYKIAKENGVPYVYVSDLYGSDYENTYCPVCGHKLIERSGSVGEPSISIHCSIYEIVSIDLLDGKCPVCSYEIDIK